MPGRRARQPSLFLLIVMFMPAVAWSAPLPPAQPAGLSPRDATCGRCHVDGAAPITRSLTDGECAECHQPFPPSEPVVTRVSSLPADRTMVRQTMVSIPGGEFLMGNNGRGDDGPGDEDERPAHRVRVKPFRLDRYETTNGMYAEFLRATDRAAPHHWPGGAYPGGKADHPVVYVSWHDADAFCRWAGKRLPTEAEWERAARGPDGRRFPWGDAFSAANANTPQYWLIRREPGDTMPVGSFPQGRSVEGVDDLAGNVYEWVADWYQPYPGNTAPNIHYGTKNKVLRGGSWYDCLSYGCGLSSPAYNRSRFAPEIKNKGFGFRCATS